MKSWVKRVLTAVIFVSVMSVSQPANAGWVTVSKYTYIGYAGCAYIDTVEEYRILGITFKTRTTTERVCANSPSFYSPIY